MLTKEQKDYVKALVRYKKKTMHERFDDDDKYWFAHCEHKVTANEINMYIKEILKERGN